MSNNQPKSWRILIADDEVLLAQRFAEYLKSRGFSTRIVRDGKEALQAVHEFLPDIVFYDLMLPELNAVAFLRQMRTENLIGDASKMKVLVTSGQTNQQNVQECMRSGAADFLPKRMSHQDLFARLVLNIQRKRVVLDFAKRPSNDEHNAHYFMHLTDLSLREALKGAPVEECLHNLTGMLGIAMKAVRVSCIKCDIETRKGWVIASSDKRSISRLEIDLGKYPEILYVLTHQKPLALDNVAADPAMHFIRNITKAIHFNSMVVTPIRIGGELWGALSVRMPDTKKSLDDFEIRYAGLVANVMGLVIRSEKDLLSLSRATDPAGDQTDQDKSRNSA